MELKYCPDANTNTIEFIIMKDSYAQI